MQKHLALGLIAFLTLTACGGSKGGSKSDPVENGPTTTPDQDPSGGPGKDKTEGGKDGKGDGSKGTPTPTPTPSPSASPSPIPGPAPAPEKKREWQLKKPAMTEKDISAYILPTAEPTWINDIEGLAKLRTSLIAFYMQHWEANAWDSGKLLAMQQEALRNFKSEVSTEELIARPVRAESAKIWDKRYQNLTQTYNDNFKKFDDELASVQKKFRDSCENDWLPRALRSMQSELRLDQLPPNATIDQIKADLPQQFACAIELEKDFYPNYRTQRQALDKNLAVGQGGQFAQIHQTWQTAQGQMETDANEAFRLAKESIQDLPYRPVAVESAELQAAARKTVIKMIDLNLTKWFEKNTCAKEATRTAKTCTEKVKSMQAAIDKAAAPTAQTALFRTGGYEATWFAEKTADSFKELYADGSSSSLVTLDNGLATLWPMRQKENFLSSLDRIYRFDLSESQYTSLKLIDPNNFSGESLGRYLDILATDISATGNFETLQNIFLRFDITCLKTVPATTACNAEVQDLKKAVDLQLQNLGRYRDEIKKETGAVPHMAKIAEIWADRTTVTQTLIQDFMMSQELGTKEQKAVNDMQLSAVAVALPFLGDSGLNTKNLIVRNWLRSMNTQLSLLTGTIFDDLFF